MNSNIQQAVDQPHWSSRQLYWLALAACLLFYPLSWFALVQGQFALLYDIRLDVFLVLSLFSLPVLIHHYDSLRSRPYVAAALVVYLVAVTAGAMLHRVAPAEALRWIGRATAPLALGIALASAWSGRLQRALMIGAASALWLASLLSILVRDNVSGVSGNPNWMAATLLASSAWVAVGVATLLASRSSKAGTEGGSGEPSIVSTFAVMFVGALTLFALHAADCRASVVAIGAYVLVRLGQWRLWLLGVLIVMFCVAAIVVTTRFENSWQRAKMADVRAPLWYSTIRMVGDKPLLGHGAGQFQKSFPSYKIPDYDRRIVMAATTQHPHNEVLHVAASVGVPATIAWLMILAPTVLRPGRTALHEAARFGVITLFVHGGFDKALATSTSSVLFLLCAGVCLAATTFRRPVAAPPDRRPNQVAPVLCSLSQAAAVCFGSLFIAQDFQFQQQLRLGRSLAMNSINSMDLVRETETAQKAYGWAVKASQTRPNELVPHYLAGLLASEQLDAPDAAVRHLERAAELDPNYGYTGEILGRARLRLLVGDRAASPHLQQQAISSLEAAVDSHQFATRLQEDLLVAHCLAGQYESVLERSRELRELYRSRFELDCYVDHETCEDRLAKWKASFQDTDARILNAADVLLDPIWISSFSSLAAEQFLPYYPQVQRYVRGMKMTYRDAAHCRGLYRIRRAFPPGLSADELVARLSKTVNLVPDKDATFRWPHEVWEDLSATPREAAFLVSTVAQLRGSPVSFVIQVDHRHVVAWQHEQEVVFCGLPGWDLQRLALGDCRQDSRDAARRAAGRGRDAHIEITLMSSPVSFAHRARALSAIVASDPEAPELFPNPVVAYATIKRLLGENVPIEVAREPFARLERDLEYGFDDGQRHVSPTSHRE